MQGVANRDIKLENTLLDGSPRPLVKICDFGYSKVCAAPAGTSAPVEMPYPNYCAIVTRPVADHRDLAVTCCSTRSSSRLPDQGWARRRTLRQRLS